MSSRGPSHFALLVALASLVACATQMSDEKPEEKKRPLALATRSAAPVEPVPIPLEPPFGPLEAENAGLPCDVDAVLKAKCRRCHTSPNRHSAPFPLLTFDQMQFLHHEQPVWKHVGRVVKSGFMPYRIPANPPVEPLTDAEKKTLLDWVDAGGPRGECPPPQAPAKARAKAPRKAP